MKNFIPFTFIVSIALVLFLSSCDKLETQAIVVKDCTGTYLRINQKDYMVCNYEVLQNHSNGAEIRVDFKTAESCFHLIDLVVCEMYHENEGLIQVTKIK